MPKHHIIIGDGLTAAEFANTCQCGAGDTLTVIGPDLDNLGRGIAYARAPKTAPWKYAYLLNSPARSVDSAFSDWLSEHWSTIAENMAGRSPDWLGSALHYVELNQIASLNAPREFYGDFFHADTLNKLQVLEEKGVSVQRIKSRASNIEFDGKQLHVGIDNGDQLIADSIDVATGGAQNQRISGDDNENSFPDLFGFEARIIEKLGAAGSIIAIGSGAAMLDCLRVCQSVQNEQNLNFTAISPSGKTLKPLRPGDTFKPANYELNGVFERAVDFVDAIKIQQEKALASGHNFYETRVGLRSVFFNKSVNDFVPNIDEARKVATPLFKHFEGGTRDSIDDFHRLEKTGQTRILAGRVQRIEQNRDGASVKFVDSDGNQQTMNASVVVNCAGPGRENRFDTLTKKMLEQRWINICPQSHGLLVGKNGHTSIPGVRYLGPAVTSIGDIAQQVPLYDAFRLRRVVQEINGAQEINSVREFNTQK